MARNNIHLVFSGKADFGQPIAQMAAVQKGMKMLQQEAAKHAKHINVLGQSEPEKYNQLGTQVDGLRNSYRSLAQQSGQYLTVTKQITTATSDFNKKVKEQKATLGDIIRSRKIIQDAYKEQLAIRNMAVTSWDVDASGRVSADLFVPTTVDMHRMSNFFKQVGMAGQVMKSASIQAINWGKNMQWTGRQLTVGFSVPLTIAGGAMMKFALDSDAALTRIVKVYGDSSSAFKVSTEAIKTMAQDTAKYVADQYGLAAESTRNVMAELAATGMEGGELQGMTTQVQRLSLLGEMSENEALKLARTVKEVYGMSAKELGDVVNYFNEIENSTSLTLQDITEGIPRIAGILKATGTSIEEQTELLVAFKAAGIDIAEGANALKSINFKALAASPTAEKNFFELTGESLEALVDKHNAKFVPVMMEISALMDKLSAPDKIRLVDDVFGIHQGSRAITLIEQLARGSEQMYRAQAIGSKSAAELAAGADKEIASIQQALSTRFKRIVESIKIQAAELGTPLLQAVMPLGEKIIDMIEWFNNLGEGTKTWLMRIGLGVAAGGPLVMLVGLMGNAVGIIGRVFAGILNLTGQFKILSAEERAAQQIQEEINKAMELTTESIREQTGVIDGLARAYENVNQVQLSALKAQEEIAAVTSGKAVPGSGGWESQVPPRQMANTGTLPFGYNPRRSSGNNPVIRDVRLPSGYMTTRRMTEQEMLDMRSAAQIGALAAQDNMAKKAAEQTARAQKAQQEYNDKLVQSQKNIQGVSHALAGASMAMMGLNSFIGNEMLSSLTSVAFALSAITPIVTHFDKVARASLAGAAANGVKAAGTVRKAWTGAMAVAGSAMQSFIKLMTGPFGIAIAAAATAAFFVWDKHRKEIEKTRKSYLDMADTAQGLADVYNFQPKSPLERQMELDPDFDQDTKWGQDQRIKEMRDNNKELYDSIIAYQTEIGKITDANARKTEAFNEALVQGGLVLRQTGDPELAKRAAWDIYTILTGEFESFDAFKIRIEPELDPSGTGGGLFSQIEDIVSAADFAGNRLKTSLSNATKDVFKMDNATKSNIQKEAIQAMEAAMAIADPEQQYKAMNKAFGDSMLGLHEAYQMAIQEGWIDTGTTMGDFVTKYMNDVMTKAHHAGKYDQFAPDTATLLGWVEVAKAINSVNPAMLEQAVTYADSASVWSGRTAQIHQFIDAQEKAILSEKLYQATESGDTEAAKKLEDKIKRLEFAGKLKYEQHIADKEMMRSGDLQVGKSVDGFVSMKKAGKEAGEEITDGMADATEEVKELTRAQERNVAAWRNTMTWAQQHAVDYYTKIFDRQQDAQRKAQEEVWKGEIESIEKTHDNLEKQAEAAAEARQKLLEKKQKDEEKALEARREALKVAEDKDEEALQKRQEARSKQLEKSQELRRKNIEEQYDAQTEAIKKQIEQEEALEKKRQEMFEAERERINRLQQLYSGNIDLNMAINSGDLDEAARIASSMNAQQDDWAMQDLSKISSDASDSRKDQLQKRIDALEEEKKAELDKIKEVEAAEKEALKNREAEEDKALQNKYKRMEDELAAEREKLNEQHALQKEALDKELAAEREVRDQNRSDEIARAEESIEVRRQSFNDQLADAKAMFEEEAQFHAEMVATNETQYTNGINNMHNSLTEHIKGTVRPYLESQNSKTWEDIRTKYDKEKKIMSRQDYWEEFGEKIAKAIQKGSIGFDLGGPKNTKNFIIDGILPPSKAASMSGAQGAGARYNEVRHSGGTIGGSGSSRQGPGFVGKGQEVNVTALRGEGVLNLRAMNTPGVPQLMDSLNKGTYQQQRYAKRYPSDAGQPLPGGRGSTPLGGIASILRPMLGAVGAMTLISGMEIGAAKAESMMGSVDIKLGEKERRGLNEDQLHNAGIIVSVGRRLGASKNDILTALMTAMQESSLINVGYGDDIWGVRNPDGSLTSSLGLFQQQKWWGSKDERMDPHRSSELFYNALFKVKNRDQMQLWEAAQEVQRSAFPRAYARHESLARVLLGGAALDPDSIKPNVGASAQKRLEDLAKRIKDIREAQGKYFMPATGLVTWLFGNRRLFAWPDHHDGLDIANSPGTPVYAAASGMASTGYSFGGGKGVFVNAADGTRHIYWHLSKALVKNGEEVRRGQKIALMGNTGAWTTGPHLHFEVQRGGRPIPAEDFFSPRPTRRSTVYAGGGIRMKNGGLVPGRGFGDITPAMLEPGEFVTRKSVANEWRPLLEAMNRGEVNLIPNVNGLQSGATKVDRSSIANSGSVMYNVNVEFSGNVNSEVDIERGVRNALRRAEKQKPRNRTVR